MPLRAVTEGRIKTRLGWALLSVAVLAIPLRTSAQAGAAQAAMVQARVTAAIDESRLTTLKGNTHPQARPEFDQGAVADSLPMNRMLLLLQRSPEQEAALQKLIEEQQIKGSPNFHKWLTPDEFGKQFGPADADIQKVTQWLASQGLQNIRVGPGRTAVEFSGTVGQVRSVFHTDIHKFNVRGELRQANVSDPAIPAALAPVVAGVVSLHNFPRRSYRHTVGAFQRTPEGRIVPQMTSSTGAFFALGPADFATIYNSLPLLTANSPIDGTGVKIAIVGISNINIQDVRDFRNLFHLPANDPNFILNGPDPGLNSAEGEGDLDVQWSGAVAPGATIDLVVSEDTLTAAGVDLSALYVVDNNSADIMSLSFGACESALGTTGNAFYNALWEQAAAQGITVMVSMGDAGSAGCDDFTTASRASSGLAVSGIASTPFNVAVGGTDFDDVGTQSNFWNMTNDPTTRLSAKGYIPETTWNDSCAAAATTGNLTTCVGAASSLLNIVAGSGGPSHIYPKPAWQIQGNLTPADSARDTPDISLFASDGPSSKSFYVVCQADAMSSGSPPSCNSSGGSFSFLGTGGTSVAAPAFAGVMALISQKMGGRQGHANVILYKLAQGETFSNCNSTTMPLSGAPLACPFYDVTKGNNSVPCVGGSPNCSSTSGSNGVLVDPAHPTAPAWVTGTGYDLATGLGSVNIANLANAWPAAVNSFTGTTTLLAANGPTTITHGQSLSFTATVSPASGTGTPTGDVSLLGPAGMANAGVFGGSLSNGASTINTGALPGGSYSVNAHYSGDTAFAPSDSNSIPVTVAKENSRLQVGIVTFNLSTGAIISTNATSFAYGSPYILRMDILNSSTNPCQPLVINGVTTGCALDATGSVTIDDTFNGTTNRLDTGTFAINGLGHSEDQPIQLPAGTHNLSATYSGDASYNPPSGPVALTLTVSKATTATSVTSNMTSIATGGTVTLTANISSSSNSSVGPSGKVQFMSNGSNLGAAVTCTPAGATSTVGASCTATLTTAISAFPPGLLDTRPRQNPPAVLIWLAALCALVCLLLASRLPSRRRGYSYAGLVLLLLIAGALSGCSGGSGNGAPPTRSITAQYAGDANYAASTSPALTITLQ